MGIFSHELTDDLAVVATFPPSNPLGLIVNGERNSLLINLANDGKKNYTLLSAAASFHDVNNHWSLIRNGSTLKYNVPLLSASNFTVPYATHSEFPPKELGLTLWVNVAEQGNAEVQQVLAFNQTVSVVEPPTSWLDPSLLFLFFIIGTALLGGAYAAYTAFFAPTKKGRRTKRTKPVTTTTTTVVEGKTKPYEEDWIPAHHLKSRSGKSKRRDGGASSGGEDLTSGGEITSGAESGNEGAKIRKRKTKRA